MSADPRIAQAKGKPILELALKCGARLKKQGAAEYAGPCPTCGGTDRFSVNTKENIFNCRGSGGGDQIRMVEHVKGLDFGDALEFITGEQRPQMGERKRRAESARPDVAPSQEDYMPPFDPGPLPPDEGDASSDQNGPDPEQEALRGEPSVIYEYRKADGELAYQKLRFEWIGEDGKKQKTFRQRRPARPGDPKNKIRQGFVWKNPGAGERVPYRLADLIDARDLGETIYITEGEKDADTLAAWGLYATCTDLGAGQWAPELNDWFNGLNVVIVQDNDPQSVDKEGKPRFHKDGRPVIPGKDHTQAIGRALRGHARSIRVLEFPELPLKGDVTDWVEITGAGIDEFLARVAGTAKPWKLEKPGTRFGALTWQELDTPGAEIEWLIRDFFTISDRSVVAGETKAGKTFFSVHAAMCIATGRDFFGHKVKPGLVIYQAGESPRGLKKRMRAWREYFGISKEENIPIVILTKKVDLFQKDADTAPLIEEIKAWQEYYNIPLRLIVIDTLIKASIGADENSSKEMGIVLDNAAKIDEETGAHVMLVHHMNAQGSKLRGSTAIPANLDQVILITHDKDSGIRTAKVDKQKEEKDGNSITFELMSVPIGIDEDNKAITSCVVVAKGEKAAAQMRRAESKGFSLRPHEEILYKALRRAIEEKGVMAPVMRRDDEGKETPSRAPEGVKCASWADWREEYMRVAVLKDDDARQAKDTAAKQMKTISETLYKFSIIDRDNPWIWLTGKKVRGFDDKPAQLEPEGSVLPFRRKDATGEDPDSVTDFL